MVIKITMKKRNKRDENEREPGSRKGKCFGVNMGIYIIGQGWMGERGYFPQENLTSRLDWLGPWYNYK